MNAYYENKVMYHILQFFGYRLIYLRRAEEHQHLKLNSYWTWGWFPLKGKGTYVEAKFEVGSWTTYYVYVGMYTRRETLLFLALSEVA
jgi:hypothetical protein